MYICNMYKLSIKMYNVRKTMAYVELFRNLLYSFRKLLQRYYY